MKTIFNGPVAGFRYGHFRGDADWLIGLETAKLLAEPKNPHDRNAILVQTPTGQNIGHIPRVATGPIHKAWREKRELTVDLRVVPGAVNVWERVFVRVRVRVAAPGPKPARKSIVRRILML